MNLRVAELVEARTPKDKGTLAEMTGTVSFGAYATGAFEDMKAVVYDFFVSGWPCHLETGKKAGKHSVHETNKWTLWKRREWRGANTAPNSGPRCFRSAAMSTHPLPR